MPREHAKPWYWVQSLFEGALRIGFGRADPENIFAGHKLQSANLFFLNKAFSTNPTVAYPGSGDVIAASLKPVEWFYVGGGIFNAYGNTTSIETSRLFDTWRVFSFGEIGFTPTIEGVGAGRYRVALWHIDARPDDGRPSDEGFSLIADQAVGEQWMIFARYGYSDAGVTNVRHLGEAGATYKGLLTGPESLTGFAAAIADPRSGDRQEKILEVFHRIQVTPQSQFTLGAQLIIDPVNAPDDDMLAVFSARFRIAF